MFFECRGDVTDLQPTDARLEPFAVRDLASLLQQARWLHEDIADLGKSSYVQELMAQDICREARTLDLRKNALLDERDAFDDGISYLSWLDVWRPAERRGAHQGGSIEPSIFLHPTTRVVNPACGLYGTDDLGLDYPMERGHPKPAVALNGPRKDSATIRNAEGLPMFNVTHARLTGVRAVCTGSTEAREASLSPLSGPWTLLGSSTSGQSLTIRRTAKSAERVESLYTPHVGMHHVSRE